MAHVITESCSACGTCLPECPVEAIKEGDPIYMIDGDTCIDCGACVDVCPTTSIVAG
jgi:NAD-dependent dihydropyrimidine dehydrogenase PreA subunit